MKRVPVELENQEIDPSLGTVTEFVMDPARLCGGMCESIFLDIEVTANSPDAHSYPDELVVPSDMTELLTYGDNPWICIDFERCRVAPTAYVMRSGGGNFGHVWPRNWDIEVSHDGSEGSWQIIDSRRDFDGFNEPYQTFHFEISDPPRELYRFFRVRETTNPRLYNMLALTHLEIFGTLFLSSDDE